MSRPVILLDVDGVLADFITANLATLRAIGIEAAHDDINQWSIEEALKLSSSQRARMKARWAEPGFCASIPVYEGAAAGVEALRAIGDVYAVTAPMTSSPTWQHERTGWLVRHLGFRRDDVVSTAAKHLVRGDILVEDRVDTLARWQAANPHGTGIVWDRRYNRDATGFHRSSSWAAVAGIAQVMADAMTAVRLVMAGGVMGAR